MAMKEFPAGTLIYGSSEEFNKLYIIARGSVLASYKGGEFVLKNGDVIGLADINYRETILEYKALEKCTVMEYEFVPGEIHALLNSNKDAIKYFLSSLFNQITKIIEQFKLIKNEYESLKDYIVASYEDYVMFCEKSFISPMDLAEYDEILENTIDDILPDWILGYYASLKEVIFKSSISLSDSDFITGLIVKSGRDIREIISLNGEIEESKKDLISLLLNESGIDLFELYISLFTKAVKKLGIDDSMVGRIQRQLNDILLQAETQGLSNKSFYSARRVKLDDTLKLAGELSKNRDEENDKKNKKALTELNGSLHKILHMIDLEEELSSSFIDNIDNYKNTVNKNGTEDDIRKLRLSISSQFNDIYLKAFEQYAETEKLPQLISMFFNFGYIDEELSGIDNAVYLYELTEHIDSNPERGVYSFYEWLKAIYNGDKDPGRDEFDTDFTDFLHELVRNKRISKAQEQAMFLDPIMRVEYELEKVFPVVNKTTTGRISTFCPVLSEHNILKSLDSMLVTSKDVIDCIDEIRSIDFGAYYRETVFSNPEQGVNKEFIEIEVLPDIILMPNIGNRAIMWQEIEGKRRTTPARMFISIFHQEDIMTQLIKLTGQFRWEMCKRIQGSRWNDISERSLTSEYFDYVQYYRKNNELSPEAKDKIKNDMVRCKNSFREMFIRDYHTYIVYEAKGAPRLNKVSRNIMLSYIPFSKDLRDKLKINPMYKDKMEKYETKQKAKLHRISNLIIKIENSGLIVPEEIMEQKAFLQS